MDENQESKQAQSHAPLETPEQHRKNKRILVWVLIIFFVLLAVLILRCCFCSHCQLEPATPPRDTVALETPIAPVTAVDTLKASEVSQEEIPVPEPEVVFSIDKLTPTNRPVDAQGYVENAESFQALYNQSCESAKASNSSELQIPVSGIAFSLNSQQMHAQGKALIEAYAKAYLSTNRAKKIQVNGYTCKMGTPKKNLVLGQARADAVVKLLKEYGVPAECITSKSYGETMYDQLPGVRGDEANRRVNIQIQ